MHYEVWALDAGNLIATPPTEAEALALVRELLAAGWDAADLAIGAARGERAGADTQMPPPISGAALATRVLAADAERTPRSA